MMEGIISQYHRKYYEVSSSWDASIGDAMVQIGQKDLLIDCQGNWGNLLTGDGAAAPGILS